MIPLLVTQRCQNPEVRINDMPYQAMIRPAMLSRLTRWEAKNSVDSVRM